MHDHGPHPTHPGHAGPSETAAGHGMVIVGEQTVYLSHLPMFMSPHDYQVILEATFTKEGSDPQAIYVKDRQQTGTKLYTLPPESFVLPDLVPTHPGGQPRRRAFQGSVVRNHFERKQTKPVALSTGVTVGVANVVHFRKFDPDAEQPAQLEYLLFGKGQELFLAHLITSPPDFDQILSVKVPGHQFADEELRHGVPIAFPGRANSPDERLKEGERVSGRIQLPGDSAPATRELSVEIGVEFYFEANELAS
jgi:hypothetical protein